jgi:hypothetical protein
MRWLPDPSRDTLAEALPAVAPELGRYSIAMPEEAVGGDPLW